MIVEQKKYFYPRNVERFQNGFAQLSRRLQIAHRALCRGFVSSCLTAKFPHVIVNLQLAGPRRGRMPMIKKRRSFLMGQERRDKKYFMIFSTQFQANPVVDRKKDQPLVF